MPPSAATPEPSPPPASAFPIPVAGEGEEVFAETIDIDAAGLLEYRLTVRREVGSLGAEIRPVDRETSDRLKVVPFDGALVVSVERDGPAARSGLVRDDVIVALGAESVRSTDQLDFRIAAAAPGAAVPLSIIREGVRLEFPLTMGSQARLEERTVQRLLPVHDDRSRTGMVLAESTGEASVPIGRIFGTGEGLLVAGLLPGGPAYLSGVRRRDLLVEACGKSLRTAEHYAEVLQGAAPGGEAALVFLRGRERLELTIPIEADATRVDEFRLPLSLFATKRSAAEKGFSVLWGALLHSRRAYEIDSGLWRDEHISRREWGFLLNLVRYSAVDGKRELRLFWILPFRSTSRTRE